VGGRGDSTSGERISNVSYVQNAFGSEGTPFSDGNVCMFNELALLSAAIYLPMEEKPSFYISADQFSPCEILINYIELPFSYSGTVLAH
jgi:hypothetical protein